MRRARIIDVSDLEPPRPMQIALRNLRDLERDEYLVFRHRREPHPLYPMLQDMGFAYSVRRGSETPVEVVIWAKGSEPPQTGS
jgi:hypothetical protein